MDGLCNSEHEPTPGLVELKKAFEPVALEVADGALVVKNNHDFVDLGLLKVVFRHEEFGQRYVKFSSFEQDFQAMSLMRTCAQCKHSSRGPNKAAPCRGWGKSYRETS